MTSFLKGLVTTQWSDKIRRSEEKSLCQLHYSIGLLDDSEFENIAFVKFETRHSGKVTPCQLDGEVLTTEIVSLLAE